MTINENEGPLNNQTIKPPILQTNRPPNNQKPHFWEPKKIDQSGKFLGGGAGLIFTQRFQNS